MWADAAAAAAACAAAAVVGLATLRSAGAPVAVNFVSGTFEAQVLVDGAPLRDAAGRPVTTPCTATGIPAGRHRVAFRHPTRGSFDFTTVREVVVNW